MKNFCGEECKCKQKSHKNNTIEQPVINEIFKYFDLLEKRDLSDYVRNIHKTNTENEENELKQINKELKEDLKKNELLKEEIMKSIMGQSAFSKELLTDMIEENNQKIEKNTKLKNELEVLNKQKNIEFEQMVMIKNLVPEWKQIYENATIEQKKMLLSSIIREITVFDDKIDIKLKIGFNEFINTAKKLNKENLFFFENITNRGACFIDS